MWGHRVRGLPRETEGPVPLLQEFILHQLRWIVPLTPVGVLFTVQDESWCDSSKDHIFTHHDKHRRCTRNFYLTHSPTTLSNFSSFNLVSIFRCSRSPHNPVYVRRVIPSVLSFSLSYHRYSYLSLLFTSRFIT